MDGIQGQSGVGESRNKAVCLNLLPDTAIDVFFFFFVFNTDYSWCWRSIY